MILDAIIFASGGTASYPSRKEIPVKATIWHNPNCSTSRHAVERADEAGADYELRKYMLKAERPTRDEIVELLGQPAEWGDELEEAAFARGVAWRITGTEAA